MAKPSSRKERFITPSMLPVEECYFRSNATEEKPEEQPGAYPFTRGLHRSMYRSRLWTMRQYAGFGSAKEANERYHYLLKQGTTGLSVAFDLPTQMGRDSDHPLVAGEVGRVGVAISSVEDMEILFEGLPLDQVSISMTINATAAILLSYLLVVAERRGIPWSALRGTIQNDILKEYIARGTYIYPPREAMRLVTDTFEFCSQHVPKWNTISISGYHIREAGSTAVEELAFTLSNGIAYVEAALSKGLLIDDFAPRLAFFFNCHNDFLEEVAKFRSARALWAQIMKDRFQAKNPDSWMLRFHTQTAGSSLTAQQPLNNIVRTTVQAMAAVFGGTQSLHTNAYDEALGLPTEESALVALRTQQIVAHESGIAQTVDPFGGSYLMEEWTQRMSDEVMKRIQRIDEMGGMLKAIEEGYPQREIERSSYAYQQQVESKEQVIVGVNDYVTGEEQELLLMKIDPSIELGQRNRVAQLKTSRDNAKVREALDDIGRSVMMGVNVLPFIIAASRVGATLGEISDVFRSYFGEYRGAGMGKT